MTRTDDSLTIEEKYVLVFDICSSTTILEDLQLSNNEKRWRDLLIEIKQFMISERDARNFEIYKFMGDGWILLFNMDYPPAELFSLLKRMCDKYDAVFKKNIRGVLNLDVKSIGLTFGLEKGRLIHFEINDKWEYIGRPINLAARLQGAIKDDDEKPEGKVLMSKPVFDHVRNEISNDYTIHSVFRTLRNVASGHRYRAIKLALFEEPAQISLPMPRRKAKN